VLDFVLSPFGLFFKTPRDLLKLMIYCAKLK